MVVRDGIQRVILSRKWPRGCGKVSLLLVSKGQTLRFPGILEGTAGGWEEEEGEEETARRGPAVRSLSSRWTWFVRRYSRSAQDRGAVNER